MTKKNVTYTSTFPNQVMEEVADYAKKHNKKKNEIITEAVMLFLKEKRKSEYAEGFEKMKNDPEQMVLAESGLEDYLKMLEDYEKQD